MSSYISQADLLSKVSNAQLIQLTDDAQSGSIDATKVTQSIDEAESEVNGYVATRHSVPLSSPIPQLIKTLAVDIAIYKLYSRRQRVPESVRKAYEDAIKKLEGISKGLMTLGVDPAPAASSKATAGKVIGPERVFDRDKLGSF